MKTTFEMSPRVPDNVVIVAESGFFNAADIAEVVRAGADAVLIGESLMRSEHPSETLRGLISEANTLMRRNPALRLVV
jgi:indole-3-glycerol phosphate synthase